MSEYEQLKDEAQLRIAADNVRGKKPNIADLLVLGTNYKAIEGWFKDAYQNLPEEP